MQAFSSFLCYHLQAFFGVSFRSFACHFRGEIPAAGARTPLLRDTDSKRCVILCKTKEKEPQKDPFWLSPRADMFLGKALKGPHKVFFSIGVIFEGTMTFIIGNRRRNNTQKQNPMSTETRKHSLTTTATIFLGILLLSGCVMEKPTVRNYRKVSQMQNLTPVTVEQLRQIVAADTTHYKVVVLTSSCCGYCIINMRDLYPKKMAEYDSNTVSWYFVEESYSSAQYMDEVFTKYHIDSPRYWINDTLPQYRPLKVKNMFVLLWNLFHHYGESYEEAGFDVADNRLNNIVNAIAPQQQTITNVIGVPTTLLLDPQGRMKCTCTIANDGTTLFGPTELGDITVPITQLDFAKVDTLNYASQVCTPEGCQ